MLASAPLSPSADFYRQGLHQQDMSLVLEELLLLSLNGLSRSFLLGPPQVIPNFSMRVQDRLLQARVWTGWESVTKMLAGGCMRREIAVPLCRTSAPSSCLRPDAGRQGSRSRNAYQVPDRRARAGSYPRGGATLAQEGHTARARPHCPRSRSRSPLTQPQQHRPGPGALQAKV